MNPYQGGVETTSGLEILRFIRIVEINCHDAGAIISIHKSHASNPGHRIPSCSIAYLDNHYHLYMISSLYLVSADHVKVCQGID